MRLDIGAPSRGWQDNSLRKKSTARTYRLSNGTILIEFFNRQAVLISSESDFYKLERTMFVKNSVDFLKKNISYKIQLTFDEGSEILRNERPRQLSQLKSEMPEDFDFSIYELNTGQILFLDKSRNHKKAAIYPDLKTLSSEKSTILEQVYDSQDDEYLMKRLAAGDRLADYDVDEQLIYPKYLKDVIKYHQLTLVEKKVYVSSFFGNLYQSARGYFILIDEARQ